MSQLDIDTATHPQLFAWQGPIDRDWLTQRLSSYGWTIPGDLVDLWVLRGGGDLFESETIFRPTTDRHDGEDLGSATEYMRASGLPAAGLVFHRGVFTSVIEQPLGEYLVFDQNFRQTQRFRGLDDWYLWLRGLFEEKYRLSPALRKP